MRRLLEKNLHERSTEDSVHPFNAADNKGRTVVQYALMLGNDLSKFVLDNLESDLTIADTSGRAVLHWAITSKNEAQVLEVIRALDRAGGDKKANGLRQTDSNGWTPLHYAAHSQCGTRHILDADSTVDVDARDLYSQTPLMIACANGHAATVATLLDGGASHAAANSLGCLPIHIAAFNKHDECCESLIGHGCNVDALDGSDMTPLMSACEVESVLTAKVLCDGGAKVDTKNARFQTALHVAILAAATEICALLVDVFGADVDSSDADGNTGLFLAMRAEHHGNELVVLLIRLKASLTLVNKAKQTALHVLCMVCLQAEPATQLEMATQLISNGIAINQVDSAGNTALDYAVEMPGEMPRDRLVQLLKAKGAILAADIPVEEVRSLRFDPVLLCCWNT
jgi:ankyrin repeat protein